MRSKGSIEKAVEIESELCRKQQNEGNACANAANHLMALQRLEEAEPVDSMSTLRRKGPCLPHNALYGIAFLASDSAALVEQQRWFAGQPTYANYGLALGADTAAYAGRVNEARELNKKAVDSAIKPTKGEWRGLSGQCGAAASGVRFPEEARQSAAAALKLAPASAGATASAVIASVRTGVELLDRRIGAPGAGARQCTRGKEPTRCRRRCGRGARPCRLQDFSQPMEKRRTGDTHL